MKTRPIFVVFGIRIADDICSCSLVFPTAPEHCRHATLKHSKKPILLHFNTISDHITAVVYAAVTWCTTYFDILNHLNVDHQCNRQTDEQNYDSNNVRLTTRAKNYENQSIFTESFAKHNAHDVFMVRSRQTVCLYFWQRFVQTLWILPRLRPA